MTLYLLVAGNMWMAREFCRRRELPITEIGRTVFTTSMDESIVRGRRAPFRLVFGFDDDPRPFKDPDRAYTPKEREMMNTVLQINEMAKP
jgi:hypothetical protein